MEDTAYHEAGHAVIGRVLGLVCGYASIKPGPQTDLLGSAHMADPSGNLAKAQAYYSKKHPG